MDDFSVFGTHFTNKHFRELLKKNGVHHRVATLYHPQTNGSILRSAQQEEALHRIWYALRRCFLGKVLSRVRPLLAPQPADTGDVEGEWRTRALSI
ncbi:unnamed protein product [Spirodela intermedia]|uniref:Uncharacterized protein n=1 Tax=Spirodela intermedia TaxID=51605 RepID=A0A7I8J524_SPIIN|nr:unnamed protein product [Spirodela intermedia]CAA6665154.1 unnamed protein product [Spirodela intermedia]